MELLIRLFLGILPQTLFFYEILIFCNQKYRDYKLFMFMYSIFFICSFISHEWSYYSSVIAIYIFLFKISNRYFLNFCVMMLSLLGLGAISMAFYKTIDNYFLAMVLFDIFIILLPILTKNRIHKYYSLFRNNWNRHKHNSVKSLTIRNINVVIVGIAIIAIPILIEFTTS